MHALVALALLSTLQADAEQHDGAERVRSYVSRPVPRSARFLDHGDLALGVAGGTPHYYRLDLRVGLFDHVSVGVTGHWLPGQRIPRAWPVGAITFWRHLGINQIGFEIGAHYRPVLHPPVDVEQTFVPQTHFVLGTMVVSAGPFSAGLDAGAAHVRIAAVDPAAPTSFDRRTVFGGGVFARIGTRRIGVTADALAALGPDPLLVFEIMLDVRLGAFSERGL